MGSEHRCGVRRPRLRAHRPFTGRRVESLSHHPVTTRSPHGRGRRSEARERQHPRPQGALSLDMIVWLTPSSITGGNRASRLSSVLTAASAGAARSSIRPKANPDAARPCALHTPRAQHLAGDQNESLAERLPSRSKPVAACCSPIVPQDAVEVTYVDRQDVMRDSVSMGDTAAEVGTCIHGRIGARSGDRSLS